MRAQGRGTADRRRLALFALAVGGVAFTALQIVVGVQSGRFGIPGGETLLWDRAGDELRAGLPIYYADGETTFFYGPPWAVLWALTSFLPVTVLWAAIVGAKVLALRYIGGSWVGAGIACWFPVLAFDLVSGNINILIVAAIVAAVRSEPAAAAALAFAKISPVFAIHPKDWRKTLPVLAFALAVTIPWLHLWPEWIGHLIASYGHTFGPMIPIPFLWRAVAALVFLAMWRPWSRAMAAVLATPAFYYASLVLFLAPVAVVLRDESARRALVTPFARLRATFGRGRTSIPASELTTPDRG